MADEPLSRSEIVRKAWLKRRAAFVPPMKGKRMSEESRAKMSAARKGKPGNRRGKKHTEATRAKISATTRANAARGKDAPGYIDGRGTERCGLRSSAALKRWRYDVYLRDGFACRHCGDDRGGNLNAHHIRSFAKHSDLRFDARNGVTLCEGCHWLVHAYGLQLWSPIQPLL